MKSIRPKPVDMRGLKLSPEEGFVLSRVDGATTVKELVALTGLDETRVVDIVSRLAADGALEVEGHIPASPPSAAPSLAPIDGALTEADNEAPDPDAEPDADAAEESDREPDERNYRQIYETVFHPMPRDLRLKAATEATGSDLFALCFDADPPIILEVLANAHASVEHARMVAHHHRTQIGLEGVAKRAEHLKDNLVQRRLLRNPQIPTTVLTRIVTPKMMLETYKIAIDREIPERSRTLTRDMLRKKFMTASSDEKAALLFKTEGRCLVLLVQCNLDAHATQILCGKSTYSMLFVQNLARWTSTPPALLGHLLRLQIVRRNEGLRKLLLKHPNTPADAKRSLG